MHVTPSSHSQVSPEFSDHCRSMEIASHNCHVRKRKAAPLEGLAFNAGDDLCAFGSSRRRKAKSSKPIVNSSDSVPRWSGDEGLAHVSRAGNTPQRLYPSSGFSDTLLTPRTKTRSSHVMSLVQSFCPALVSTPQSKGASSPHTATPSHVISPSTPSPLSPTHKHLDITVLASETPPLQTLQRVRDCTDGVECISETPHPQRPHLQRPHP